MGTARIPGRNFNEVPKKALVGLLIGYLIFPIFSFMPIIRQMLGSWAELEASAWTLPASLVGLLLIYTAFNRIPEAGSFLRCVWKWGRWLLVGAYVWSAVVLLATNSSVLLRDGHHLLELMLVLLTADLLAAGYLLVSVSARQFFANFPTADDVAAQEKAVKTQDQERHRFIRDAQLAVPIAQTPEEERVESHWRAEINRDEHQALPWLELGVLAYQCGKGTQALALMEKALQCDTDNPIVLRNLCELYRQQKQFARAAELGVRAVELAPADTVARLNLAQVYVDDGKFDQAMSQYHRVLELEPQHVQTWLNMAILLMRQGRELDAAAALDAVLLLDPQNERAISLKRSLPQ
jgi:tetratricopeptide (TPR) repeat protein